MPPGEILLRNSFHVNFQVKAQTVVVEPGGRGPESSDPDTLPAPRAALSRGNFLFFKADSYIVFHFLFLL